MISSSELKMAIKEVCIPFDVINSRLKSEKLIPSPNSSLYTITALLSIHKIYMDSRYIKYNVIYLHG